MFQQTPKKERSRLASLTAPANMLNFRTTSTLGGGSSNSAASSQQSQPAHTSSSNRKTSFGSSSAASPPAQAASNALPSISSVLSSPQFIPSDTSNSVTSPDSSIADTAASTTATSTASASTTGPNLTADAHKSQRRDRQATTTSSGPASSSVPANNDDVPGLRSSLAQLAQSKQLNQLEDTLPISRRETVTGQRNEVIPVHLLTPAPEVPAKPAASSSGAPPRNTSSPVPMAKRAPVDPYDAPGVSFRSTLRPPTVAQVPDIPYGPGQGRRKKPRQLSGSGRAKQFTPSPVSSGLRMPSESEAQAIATAGNTARNASYSGTRMAVIASTGPALQTGQLVVPAAPLTVNAKVVNSGEHVITRIDQQDLEKFNRDSPAAEQTTPVKQIPSASASKSPTKSAMKQNTGRSWADLVRPVSNMHIAQEAVANIGLSPEVLAQEAARKKRVSIALPRNAVGDTPSEHSLQGGYTTPPQTVLSGSSTPSVQGNDKSPKHVSPPPHEQATSATPEAGSKVETNGPSSIKSTASPNAPLLSSILSKKRTLDEILYGVESSQSGVVLYPRGLVNTGNACFMNSILQVLLFTAPFYNLVSLIGLHTSEDLNGRTPLLDALVGYLGEFKQGPNSADRERAVKSGESYEESIPRNGDGAFIPNVIYHALNSNARFAQMGFYNPSMAHSSSGSQVSANGLGSRSSSRGPAIKSNANHLSQEDAQEFLGFFLDTIHDELLIKTEQHDKSSWERASRGYKQGMDILSRQSVNSAADYAASLQTQALAPPASIAGDEDWLEVGTKGRTATTRTTEATSSAITRIFGGQLRSVLRRSGQKDSVTLEPYMSLQLEIQPNHVNSVEDALALISTPELISDVANRNNAKSDATKQVYIEQLPSVLILHLKRFVYDEKQGGVLKSHKMIAYDHELSVPQSCLSPLKRGSGSRSKYRLTGVVYHHGKSASGGHYTVAVRQNNGRWLNIDDTHITPITEDEAVLDADKEQLRLSLPSASTLYGVAEKCAYLLFYQRI